jgi:hypothetical protein
MGDLLCAACSQPIQSTDERSTVEQVDACTLAVERVTYHAACRDGAASRAAQIAEPREAPRGGPTS